jgi:hypothetical protein
MQAPFYLEFVPNHVLDAPPGTGYMARAKPEDRALDYPNQVGPHACMIGPRWVVRLGC